MASPYPPTPPETHHIEQICLRWLQQWAAFPPTPVEHKELSELLYDCRENGILHPVILSVHYPTHTLRLDSGNHRIWFLPLLGYTHVPCVALISLTRIPEPLNGTHIYQCPHPLPKRVTNPSEANPFYIKPSRLFPNIPKLG